MNTTNTKKDSILYVCPNGFLGGAEKVVLDCLEGHIKSNQFNIRAISFSDGAAVTKAHKQGIIWDVLPIKFKLRSPLKVLRACLYLRSYCKKYNIRLINACMPYGQIISSIATIGTDIKTIWHQHGPVGGILDRIAAFTNPVKIFHNSHHTFSEHQKIDLFERPYKTHQIIPLGVDSPNINEEKVNEIRNRYKEKCIVLTVGRISEGKGFHLIIEAIKNLNNQNIVLLIAGDIGIEKDQAYKDKLIEMVESYKLSDSIFFLEHINNIHDYFEACDLYISSSIVPEGFGLVVAEAMLHKKIVIGPNFGAINELIEDGVNGFSFDTRLKSAPNELKNIIQHTLENNIHNKITENAFHFIVKNYSKNKMIQSLEESYLNLLK